MEAPREALDLRVAAVRANGRPHIEVVWSDPSTHAERASLLPAGKAPEKSLWNALARVGSELGLTSREVHDLYTRQLPAVARELEEIMARLEAGPRFQLLEADEARATFERRKLERDELFPLFDAMERLQGDAALIAEPLSLSQILKLKRVAKERLGDRWTIETTRADQEVDRRAVLVRLKA